MTGPQPPYGEAGGQWPSGGDWQAPSDQTQYGGPPQPGYDQPQSYEQPGFQPQSYDQYAQPGYADQYSAPPAGYQQPFSGPPAYQDPNPMAVPPPAPSKSNPLPLILGGAAVVLVLILLGGIGIWALASKDSGGGGGPGGSGSGDGGAKYDAASVSNACDLLDAEALKAWAENPDGEPDHNENRYSGSASFSCYVTYKTEGDSTSSATMTMNATVSDYAEDSYKSLEELAKGSTGSGKENGDVSGIGEKAYFSSEFEESEYFTSASYELGVLDANLYFSVRIWVFKDGKVELSDVEAACKDQAKKIMDKMKG